jgi:pimeloyl-ACP methyl ester carboxylesterase
MTDGYERSMQLLTLFRQRDTSQVSAAGRTIALLHGQRTQRVTLLFHGLSASPTQFIELGRKLYERGQNVLVPRLPKHGYTDRLSDALAGLTAADLRSTALRSLEIARGLGEHVTVAGFSLGGLLTAWLAQNEPIDLAVPVAPYMGLSLVPNRLAPRLARWALDRPNFFAWWNPIQRERQMPEHGYPRVATHALAQAYEIAGELRDAAAQSAPRAKRIIAVTNSREAAVSNRAVRALVSLWKTQRLNGIDTYEFVGLPISHDIVEPRKNPAIFERVYPILLKLLEVE